MDELGADITISPKHGYQWSHKKLCFSKPQDIFDYFALAVRAVVGGLSHPMSGADRRGPSDGGSALVQARSPQ